jgi:hypothetical protein
VFRGERSLRVDLSGVTGTAEGGARRSVVPVKSWKSTQGELQAFVWTPAGSQLRARLILTDRRLRSRAGAVTSLSAGAWTAVRLPEARVDPGFQVRDLHVEITAEPGTAAFSGSVYVDHVLVRGVVQRLREPSGSTAASFAYAWDGKTMTAMVPDDTGAAGDISYSYDTFGYVTAQDVAGNLGKTFTEAEMDAAEAYWTEERMEAAGPTDEVAPPSEPTTSVQAASIEEPSLPQECAPGDDGEGVIHYDQCDYGTSSHFDPGMTVASHGTQDQWCQENRYLSVYNWGCHMFTPGDSEDRYGYPYRVNGALFYVDNAGEPRRCSATVISTRHEVNGRTRQGNRSTIWTAGHCLIPRNSGIDKFHTRLVFVPGYRAGTPVSDTPYGSWAIRSPHAPLWRTSRGDGALRWDWGSALARPRGCPTKSNRKMPLQECVGAATITFNGRTDIPYIPHGYPARETVYYPHSGAKLWRCSSGFSGFDLPGTNAESNWGPATIGIGCRMGRGSSGGAWFYPWGSRGGTLRTVFSYSPNWESGERRYGPYLGSDARNLFIKMRSLPPPP